MNNRVREIRKHPSHSNNTLEKFGESIGIKKSALSLIENGKNALTEQNIKSICREYNVNEEWLRTGEGEMFIDVSRELSIAKLTVKLMAEEPDSFKNRLVAALAKLSVEQWEVLEGIAKEMADSNAKKEE